MKHIFIVNPAAGSKSPALALIPELRLAAQALGAEYEIYETKHAGDATEFVRARCGEAAGTLRFHACGGDGTLNEVVAGAIGQPNAEVAVIPVGSGNDFFRVIAGADAKADISRAIRGTAKSVDAIRYTAVLDGGAEKSGYAINMCNIGFDAAVVEKAGEIKKIPLLGGPMSYLAGVFSTLVKKPVAQLEITADGTPYASGEFLLCTVANGAYCGGGYFASPLADIQDGELNFVTVKNITRRFFVSILSKYRAGEHLTEPRLKGVIDHTAAKKLTIAAKQPAAMAIDGEVVRILRAEFEIVPGAVRLAVPVGE
ncbi:MAG: hypothetical protein LBQ91_01090 [Oscillospiraceae bacterium]|jgi:YegS/Rv2252/BmrU family lipid kinase|nr:hypothetical protein [Oscillospiraceae bacterium]